MRWSTRGGGVLARLSVVGLVAVVAGCESPTVTGRQACEGERGADTERGAGCAYAFAPTEGPVVHWPLGSTIRVFVAGDAAEGKDVLRQAFEAGARAWNDAVLLGEYRLVPASAAEQADIVLAWSQTQLPVDTDGCRPTLRGAGVTTFCVSSEDSTRLHTFPLRAAGAAESRVRMVMLIRNALAEEPARARQITAHELGHALGILTHSGHPRDLMFYGPLDADSPSPADRQTVQLLYHTRPDVSP